MAIWTREHSAAYFFQNESSGTRSLCSWSVFHRLALSRAFTLPTPAHAHRHHTRNIWCQQVAGYDRSRICVSYQAGPAS